MSIMKTVKEKQIKKYVLATIADDGKTYFLLYSHKNKKEKAQYLLETDIERATKADDIEAAETMLQLYEEDMGERDVFVIVPLIITYELVDETSNLDATSTNKLADETNEIDKL